MRHLENMAKVMLATGLIVGYGYVIEIFIAWYSGNQYEEFMILNRMTGPYRLAYWCALILCNVLAPQLLWFKKVRTTPWLVLSSSRCSSTSACGSSASSSSSPACTATSCPRPGACTRGTFWDWATFIGTIGLFLALIFLFIRFLPMISIFEMRTILPGAKEKQG